MAIREVFPKRIYIRLAEDGTGFTYQVRYGWLAMPARRIHLFEEGTSVVPMEVRLFEQNAPATKSKE